MKFKIFLLSALAALAFSCGHSAQSHNHDDHAECSHDHSAELHAEHDHDHSGHSHDDRSDNHENEGKITPPGESHTGEIFLSQEQAEQLGITYMTVEPRAFTGIIRTSGIIESAPGDAATIVATVAGTVSFVSAKFSEGAPVARGTTLFSIRSGDMTDSNLDARIAEAKARLQKAQADYDRVEALFKDRLVTAAQVEEARLALAQAKLDVETLGRNTSAGGRAVSSPMGGYITSVSVQEGDYVVEGATLATISANRNLVLRADLPLRFFFEANNISSANFITPHDGKTYDIAGLGGKLLSVARNTAAENSYTLPVRFSIDNRAQFIPGSVVEVYLKTSERQGIITVPVSALTEEGGSKYVYLRVGQGVYNKRLVKTGVSDGVSIEIISGLTYGDEIVASGAYFVRLAAMSGEIPHGHSH